MNAPIFKNKNFLLHFALSLIAQVGGFFTIVALPWLVLDISDNNPLTMSFVMACGALPHAIFMLVGGVIADKYSPLKIIIISRLGLFVCLLSLGFLVYFNHVQILSICIFAFFSGVFSSMMVPGNQSLLPSIVPRENLGIANGIFIGGGQIAPILGPFIAGWLIYLFRVNQALIPDGMSTKAYAYAFFIDAVILFVVIICSNLIKIDKIFISNNRIWNMLREGVVFCWNDLGIRLVLGYLILISFFINGTLAACLPLFAKIHLGVGENDYGNLYAVMGLGIILGVGFALLIKPSNKQLGLVVLLCDFVNAGVLLGLGNTNHYLVALGLMFVLGFSMGIVVAAGTTWFQLRTPPHLMGRVMGVLMFCIYGFVPISVTVVGKFLTTYDIQLIMRTSGVVIVIFVVIGLLIPKVRMMGNINPYNSDKNKSA